MQVEALRCILVHCAHADYVDLQAKIFDKAPEGSRKCIISTNIAEVSFS